jgi:hypothetical protein
LASRIIDYKIAMLLWLALSSTVGLASAAGAAYACQGRIWFAPEANALLDGVIGETPMLESDITLLQGGLTQDEFTP